MNKKGTFVTSLDFELFWGVVDSCTIENYGKEIEKARETIPELLEIFSKHGIHATWGTVGMLFASSKDELIKYLPQARPNYVNIKPSAYEHLETIGLNEKEDCLHYAHSLIKKILEYNNQEIGSHTFGHYYCREEGQNNETFNADIIAAKKIAKELFGIEIKSFIFPRNQFNKGYIESLRANDVSVVRGNQENFVYNENTIFSRIFRLIDTYIPICGSKSYYKKDCIQDGIVNLKASIFFRKYNKKLFFLETLKMWNIKLLMTIAARKGKVLHIWWHPHNMGSNPDIFLKQIDSLLQHYKKLYNKYGFESKTMGELAKEILDEKNCNFM